MNLTIEEGLYQRVEDSLVWKGQLNLNNAMALGNAAKTNAISCILPKAETR